MATASNLKKLADRRKFYRERGYSEDRINRILFGSSDYGDAADSILRQVEPIAAPPGNPHQEYNKSYVADSQAYAGDDTPRRRIRNQAGRVLDSVQGDPSNEPFHIPEVDQLAQKHIEQLAILEGRRAINMRKQAAVIGTVLGSLTPVIGPQQALFGALRGETLDSVLARIWPSYIVPDDEGELVRKSAFVAGLSAMKEGFIGTLTDDPDRINRAIELGSALAEGGGEDLLGWKDVFEANLAGYGILAEQWPESEMREAYAEEASKEAAGELYRNLYNNGFAGRTAMHGLGMWFWYQDFFADPLIGVSELPVLAFRGLRAAAPAAARARVTGAISRRTMDPARLADALSDAEKWATQATERYVKTGSQLDMRKAAQAKKNLAELRAIDSQAKSGVGAEAMLVNQAPVRDPSTVVPKKYADEVWAYSPTRGVSPESRKSALLQELSENIRRGAREGLQEEQLRGWEELFDLVNKTPADELPARLTARGELSAEAIDAELHALRLKALGDEGSTIFHHNELSEADLRQRLSFTADDAEMNGEAFKRVLTGASVDDVTINEQSIPHYMASHSMRPKAVTGDGFINEQAIRDASKEAAERINAMRAKRIEYLEDVKKGINLEDASDIGSTEGRKFTKEMAEELDRLKKAEPVKWDDDLLGGNPLRTEVERAAWRETWGEKFGNLYARGLYPESWFPRTPAFLRALAFPEGREPMRAFKATNPQAWNRIRNRMFAREYEYQRASNIFRASLVESGAFKETSRGAVKMADKTAATQMFKALNVPADSPAYSQLLADMTPAARRSVRRLRQVMDFYADKQGISGTERYIEGYIHHLFSSDMFAGGAVPHELRMGGPKVELTVRHLLDRTGEGVVEENLVEILEAYASGMARKLHMEPLYHDLKWMADEFVKANPADKWMLNYTDDIIATMKGEPSVLGHVVDRRIGDVNVALRESGVNLPPYQPGDSGRMLLGVTSLAYAGLLTGNARYAPMAIATGIATTAAPHGLASVFRGFTGFATPEGQALAEIAGVKKQWSQILEHSAFRKLSDLLSDVPAGTPSINQTEYLIRGVTMWTAIDDLMKRKGFKSFEEMAQAGYGNYAMQYGARQAEEVNHMFGILGKPVGFTRMSKSGSVAATQFLSFIPKQTEQILAMTLKNPGAFAQYMMVSGLLQRMAVMEFGIDMSSYLGFGYVPDDARNITSVAADAGMKLGIWASRMAEAMAGNADPTAVAEAQMELWDAIEPMIPLAEAYNQWAGRVSAAVNAARGEEVPVRSRQGELIRTLNLDSDLAERMERIETDIFSTISGLRSVQDRISQDLHEASVQVQQEKAFYAWELTKRYRDAAGRSDMGGTLEAYKEMIGSGLFPYLPQDLTSMSKHYEQSLILDRQIRDLLKDKRLMSEKLQRQTLISPYSELGREAEGE